MLLGFVSPCDLSESPEMTGVEPRVRVDQCHGEVRLKSTFNLGSPHIQQAASTSAPQCVTHHGRLFL